MYQLRFWAISVEMFLLSSAIAVHTCLAESVGEVTRQEIIELINHVKELPPKCYDIDVVAEFKLIPKTEEHFRSIVARLEEMTKHAGKPQTEEARAADQEKQVQRLLKEQSKPRRMRKRCRFSFDHGYRLDSVIEKIDVSPSLDTGLVENADFTDWRVNVGGTGSKDLRSVKSSPKRKIADLFPDGRRVLNDQVWQGGTIGLFVGNLFKAVFRLESDDEQKSIESVVDGTNDFFKLRVERDVLLPDGSLGRNFLCTVKDKASGKSAEFSIVVPAQSIKPVWRVVAGGKKVLEVHKLVDGEATVWTDYMAAGVPDGVKYTVLSKSLKCDLDPELFAFKAPTGFTYVDHTVNPPMIHYADGRVVEGKLAGPPVQAPVSKVSATKGKHTWFIVGNILMLISAAIFFLFRRLRSST